MTNPIDVLTEAVRVADAGHCLDPRRYAAIVANALTDDQIVANAVQELKTGCWGKSEASDLGMNDQTLEDIACAVLRSVGGE